MDKTYRKAKYAYIKSVVLKWNRNKNHRLFIKIIKYICFSASKFSVSVVFAVMPKLWVLINFFAMVSVVRKSKCLQYINKQTVFLTLEHNKII